MAANYLPYEPQQMMLLPETLQEWLPDAGYRREALLDALAGRAELVMAIGREGKEHRAINEVSLPLTAEMTQKMKTQVADRATQWLDQERPGF